MSSIFNTRSRLWLVAFHLPIFASILLDFSGLYGQDAYAYLQMSMDIDILNSGDAAKDFYWPILYPLFGAILQLITASPAFSLQLISIAAFAFCAVILYDILRSMFDASNKVATSYILLFFVFSPYLFRFGMLVMSDMLCLLFVLISLKYSMIKEVSSKNVSFAVVAAVLAISTRYVSLLLVCIPLSYLFVNVIRKRHYKALTIAFFFALLASIPHLFFKGIAPHGLFDHSHLQSWSVLNSFRNNFADSGSMVYQYRYNNIITSLFYLIHPAYCIFGSILIATAAYMKLKSINYPFSPVVLFSLILYLIFLIGIPFQNIRFYLLSFPLFLLLMFPAFQYVETQISKWKRLVLVALLVIQLPFILYAVNTPYQLSKLEQLMTDDIRAFNKNGLIIYTSGLEGPLAFYLPESKINGLYRDSVKVFESNFVLVIDSVKAMNQKPTSTLVVNLNDIYTNHRIIRRSELKKNWIVYEFQR